MHPIDAMPAIGLRFVLAGLLLLVEPLIGMGRTALNLDRAEQAMGFR